MYNVLGTLGTNRVKLRHKFGVPRNKCKAFELCLHICVKTQAAMWRHVLLGSHQSVTSLTGQSHFVATATSPSS